MDEVLDDLTRVAQRCERAAAHFDSERINAIQSALTTAAESVGAAWSGSWLGYQSRIYTEGMRPARPGEVYDAAYGFLEFGSETRGQWMEYDYETVRQEILRRAGDPDTTLLQSAADEAKAAIWHCKNEVIPTLDAIAAEPRDSVLCKLREELAELKAYHSSAEFVDAIRPTHITSADTIALQQGPTVPPHIAMQAWVDEKRSFSHQAKKAAELTFRAVTYLKRKHQLRGNTVARTHGKIFIGHGHSPVWKDLREFLKDKLRLEVVEFNSESAAGLSTKERLLNMLDESCFAFLVMTAEDESADGKKRARANVIHEAGLFQGRFGFERAIILLEDGCEEFSNAFGIGQIRFPIGSIMAKSEEIRDVLQREGIQHL